MFNISDSSIRIIFKNHLGFFSNSKSAVKKTSFFITLLFFLLFNLSNIYAQTIQVTSPNGGENWYKGYTYEIIWDDDITDNVKIELWNEAYFYATITESTESDGSFIWTIPEDLNPSDWFRINIESVSNPTIDDISDDDFEIFEFPTISSPNGGENWDFEEEYNIEWTDYINDDVRIELWKGGTEAEGGVMAQIITTSTASDGFFRWHDAIDLEEDDDYKVRIRSIPGNDFFEEYSTDFFSITNNTPEGGLVISLPHDVEHEILSEGDVDWYTFTLYENTTYRFYNTSSINLDTKLTLYKGQWEEYFNVILHGVVGEDDNSGGNQQPFFDYTPEFPVEQVWLKVAISDDINESAETTGDYTLRIYDLSNQSVTVTNPNVRVYWNKGSTYEITWIYDIDENVRIDLWKGGTYDQGGTQIVITTSTESDGSYNWTIPSDVEIGMDYKIRVKSVIDPSNKLLFDYSDTYFTIETDHSQSSVNSAVEITIPHEQEYQISGEDDIDWYNFQLDEGKTYRVYNTSTINLDTEVYLHRGFLEDGSVTLMEIVALDDNSGGNQQPFFDYLAKEFEQYEGLNFWLQVALDYNETSETEGDYTLHIYELSDKLNLKMFLEGAYNQATDMMNSQLGTNIPKTSPYSAVGEQTVVEIPEGVVDWVLVELRDKADNLHVVSSRSAFLLNTGMIVETDGVSDVQFNAPKDSYYIVVKHRNHLPVMSSGLVEF